MRQGKIKYAFPGSNTAKGFQAFYRDNLADLERVMVLKGGPGSGKSTIIKKISMAMVERGYDVELWQCSSDNDSLDGVMIPALKVAVVDGTYPHVLDPIYPGAAGEWINLGEFWDGSYLWSRKKEIISVNKEVSQYFSNTYVALAQALAVLKQIEAEKTASEDDEKMAALADRWMGQIFSPEKAVPRHLFASAITPGGLVTVVQNIIENCREKYVLCDGSLTAKTQILQKMADNATARGHRVVIYHMPLDPDQLELVVLPDLGIAMMTQEVLGKDYQLQEDDIVLSLAEGKKDALVLGESHEESTAAVSALATKEQQYEDWLKEAVTSLQNAKARHDDLEAFYCQAMDYDRIDTARKKIFNHILAMAAEKEKK